jgi:hypothetical protein
MVVSPLTDEIFAEADLASVRYGPPASTHESLGVLLEEFDELRQAVHANDCGSIRYEAIQIAAVAYRLALACSRCEPAFMTRSNLTDEGST